MSLCQLVSNLYEQVELFSKVSLRSRDARVTLDFKRLRQGLSTNCQLQLISAGDGARAAQLSGPENQTRKTRCVRIAKVPDEAIQTCFGGNAAWTCRSAKASLYLFARRGLWLFWRRCRRRACSRSLRRRLWRAASKFTYR